VVLLSAGTLGAAQPGILVRTWPVRLTRRVYNPAFPPADLRKALGTEAGLCVYQFRCETRLSVDFPRFAISTVKATIESAVVETHLEITLWVPADGTAKLVAHEEAHRQICEAYYRDAQAIAEQAAGAFVGQRVKVPVAGRDAALKAILKDDQSRIIGQFMAETATRCGYAQERFDAITNHGRDPVPEADALARAIREEREHRGREPARPPPGAPVLPAPKGDAI
jgi:hypothetical protein